MTAPYRDIIRRMVEIFGHTTQSMGIGRVSGQIFAYLYFSRDPKSLDDLTAALGISKGSASMCVRQLEQWEALEKVWIRGDRKDYYRARDRLGRIIKNAMADLAGKRIAAAALLLDEVEREIPAGGNGVGTSCENDVFMAERIRHIREFQQRTQEMWNSSTMKMLLG